MVHKELAKRLREDVKDPDLGFVSITRAELNRDPSVATIHYLPLGGGEPSQAMQDAVGARSKKLRVRSSALRLRHAPKLDFIIDRHTEAAFRVNDLLAELQEERDAEPNGEDSET